MMATSPRLVILLLVGCAFVLGQQEPGEPKPVARYDNYYLYQMMLGTEKHENMFEDLEKISDCYMFFTEYRPYLSGNVTVLVAAHKTAEFRDLINRYQVPFSVISSNYQDVIDQSYASVSSGNALDMDWEHYYSRNDINQWLKSLADKYNGRVQIIKLGRSHEGRPIRGVKLTNGPYHSTVFVEAGIYGSDWISTSTANFILNELLTSADPAVREIALAHNWIIVPIVNPDGYVYTFEKDRLWRKSRQPLSEGICVGIDLNRNFGFGWNGTGSSYDPCHTHFAGDSELTTPETQTITKFILENRNASRIETYLSLHGHSQRITFPYGDSKTKEYDEQQLRLNSIDGASRRYPTVYESGSIEDLKMPSLSGSSVDWAHAIAGIPITLSIDLRGPRENTDMSILPADQIHSVGMETVDALVGIIRGAKQAGYYVDDVPEFI